MKILMIGTDKNIFENDSEVRQRMIEYGCLAEQLHIIVFTKRTKNYESRIKNKILENTFIYPTNSFSRWCYIFDAVKIGNEIIGNWKLEIGNSHNRFLITCQDPFEIGLVGWLLKRKFRLPLQLQIHTDIFSPYFSRESLLNKIRVLLAKFLIPRAACVRVVSERIKNGLAAGGYPLNSITVLPVFIDAAKIKSAPIRTNLHQKYPQFDFIILMASRLTAEKNIGLAVETMAEIVKDYPKTGLIIVGDGPEREALKLKTKNEKLEINVIFENWTDDLASYYKTADLFLLTSNYEGYGRTIIEAVVSGCRVISGNVGIADEILDKENIFEPGNGEQLKQKTIKTIKGRLPFVSLMFKLPTKDEYLRAYKKSWENCGGDIL